ncbi:DUF5103 domain-containing protein [Dysgonomonas sp. Marseille-P4361]|uniref:type IX secretion system plug protein n=1 Tax=Dysgonomonas sp. Marseille-P4361 TaxID=2161820 RepID=UPI000D562854|nr:DUF5103 domain-containing protein [Dysgonomonas sp. Marseille-P4361]
MMKYKATFILLFFCNLLLAQPYRTQALSPEIHTIEVSKNGNSNFKPIIELNKGDFVKIDFDRISEDSFNRLRYRVLHCDAYWKVSSSISEIDYMSGFNDNYIDTYDPSINTTVEYTHFSLRIPNNEIQLKLSGNYVVEIYEEDDPETVLLTACFSVVDNQLSIASSVSSNTDIDTNRNHQQLSFTLHHQGMNIRDPHTELIIFAQQNNRLDNEKAKLKPTYVNPGKLIFEHNRDLIFEAGNEYRRFETSSYRSNGMNVAHIEYRRPTYIMDIAADKVRANRGYSYDQDQNGKFFIRTNEGEDNNIEADYFVTNFTIPMEEPISDDIYINGDFTNNTFSEKYKMLYDEGNKVYYLSLLLKQGMYNYQYLTKSGNRFSTSKIEGNYHETENEYIIYVYYRPSGQRYDSLIGVQTIYSREK